MPGMQQQGEKRKKKKKSCRSSTDLNPVLMLCSGTNKYHKTLLCSASVCVGSTSATYPFLPKKAFSE